MTENEKDVAKEDLDLKFQSSPDFLRSLPEVDRVGADPITYLGGSGPSLTAAPPFGPQEQEGAGREAEADDLEAPGHQVLPVKRTLTMLENELNTSSEGYTLECPELLDLPWMLEELLEQSKKEEESSWDRHCLDWWKAILARPDLEDLENPQIFSSCGTWR